MFLGGNVETLHSDNHLGLGSVIIHYESQPKEIACNFYYPMPEESKQSNWQNIYFSLAFPVSNN